MFEPRSAFWDPLFNALMDPAAGVVRSAEAQVRFGFASYKGLTNTGVTDEVNPACATVTQVPYGLDNYDAINTAYTQLGTEWVQGVKWETPTGHAITRVVPDLSVDGHKEAWYRLEVGKRRLAYSLLSLRLPFESLEFEFLADAAPGAPPVLTGHAGGVITLNIAEANDAERERLRLQLHEPYRTLLGHFRHEVGHYYWERLISGSPRLQLFRVLFGDETAHYGEALQNHYWQGPPPDWQNRYVSAYASAHPWEDWAETWAHYLHMTDTLETAAACGLSLRPRRRDEPELKSSALPRDPALSMFDEVIESWFPLTYVLNNLNRGLGLPDGYPFVLSNAAIDKLRFVHETIAAAAFQQESPGTSDTAGTGNTALQGREPAKREA